MWAASGPSKRDKLLGGAYALLHPVGFAEPFWSFRGRSHGLRDPGGRFQQGKHGRGGGRRRDRLLGRTRSTRPSTPWRGCPNSRGRRVGGTSRTISRPTRMVDSYLDIYREVLERSPRREGHRPWGFYRVLEDAPGHKVKRIQVHPGKRLSLQRHRRRSEHWTVVEGKGLVTRGGEYPIGRARKLGRYRMRHDP